MLTRICQRCGKHVKQGEKCSCYSPPERRDKEAHDFYFSYEWKRVATAARNRADYTDEYMLTYCGKAMQGNTVHHIYTIHERPDLKLSLDNLIVVSNRTHDMIHKAYKEGGLTKEIMQKKLLMIRGQGQGI